MPFVERNNRTPFKICADEVLSYAGPGVRIFSTMEQYQAQSGGSRGSAEKQFTSAIDLVRPLSRPGSLDTRAALAPKNGIWSRREGMDGQ